VASVKTVPIRKQEISEEITAYGTVLSAPTRVETLSVPFEAEIQTIHVTEGQPVSRHERLFEVRPSPDVMLEIKRAKASYKTAKDLLQRTEEQVRLKLATGQELLQARQVFQEAHLRLKSLERRGVAERTVIRSQFDGMVSHLFEKVGARVSAGAPVLEIVPQDSLQVDLGVELEDRSLIHPGQKVAIRAVNRPAQEPITGTVRSISKMVNPSTRLLDLFVTIPSPSSFLLNEYVKGRIAVAGREALVVPRSAVLREGDHWTLFTVKDRRAVRHEVSVGFKTLTGVEVLSKDLSPGDPVVVMGNYELKDGMAVSVEGSK
jgi:membrane fusion protein (multidrug efflux system)